MCAKIKDKDKSTVKVCVTEGLSLTVESVV